MERKRLIEPKPEKKAVKPGGGRYFAPPADGGPARFSTGCKLLDLAMGGGIAEGRMFNLVGDSSAGKTLIGTEAAANFAMKYGEQARIKYRDPEASYDVAYGEVVGLPADIVDFGDPKLPYDTVEDFEADLKAFIKTMRPGQHGLYILDSMDSLSDAGEMVRDEGKASYGTAKAKALSQFFRKTIRIMAHKRVTLMIISQTRSAIGVTFGEQQTRAGGKALDFYATQIVWLSQREKLFATHAGVKRPIGIKVRARVKKNKAGRPFREAEYPIVFDFGVDDVWAGAEWLAEVKRLPELGLAAPPGDEVAPGADEAPPGRQWGMQKPKAGGKVLIKYLKGLSKLPSGAYRAERKRVNKIVRRVWREVEALFSPGRSKYG